MVTKEGGEAPPQQSQEPGAVQSDVAVGPDGARYKTAKEGLARIYVPLSSAEKERQNGGGSAAVEDHPQQVFYNPIQQFNRDLSVLAIKAYGTSLVEKRTAEYARRKEQFASKKRKRHEGRNNAAAETRKEILGEKEADIEDGRPSKVEKQAEGEDAAVAATKEEAAFVEIREAEESHSVETQHVAAETAHSTTAEGTPSSGPKVPKIRILDALSATGLRALRYAHELPFGVAVTANDLLAAATESIRRNVELNGLTDKITVTKSDALAHMYTVVAKDLTALVEAPAPPGRAVAENKDNIKSRRAEKYDVIDLDPYGTAANFFDAAVQAVRNDGGLLCVTCTDAGVWASQGYPEKCFALYGGVPMKGVHSHEAGLRIVLHGLAASAARYGLAITPLLSLSIDFYCRVFVTVHRSPASVKFLAGKTMVTYNCDQGCGAWTTQPLLRNRATPNKKGSGNFYKYSFSTGPLAEPFCEHCGTKTHLAGPMYAGPLHDAGFIRRILDDLPNVSTDVYGTTNRIRGMLQTALEELIKPGPPAAATAAANAATEEGAGAGAGTGTGKEAGAETQPSPPPNKEDELAAVDPAPFFFLPTVLAKAIHCATPNDDAIRGALLRLGYHVTRSHCKAGSVKTDAPWSVVWDVMRAWAQQKAPVKVENIKPNTAAYRLLRLGKDDAAAADGAGQNDSSAKKTQEIVFDEELGRQHSRQGDKLVRYQFNPRENWGPMNRAKGH